MHDVAVKKLVRQLLPALWMTICDGPATYLRSLLQDVPCWLSSTH